VLHQLLVTELGFWRQAKMDRYSNQRFRQRPA
jgi:hypothetical protein